MTGDVVGLDVDPHPGDASSLDLVWLKPAEELPLVTPGSRLSMGDTSGDGRSR
jgi:hypothetical protein